MARIGRSFLEAVAHATHDAGPLKGWTPADSPVEIVIDLLNLLTDKDRELESAQIAAQQSCELLRDEIGELKASVEFLHTDRMAIVVERNETEERLQAALEPGSPVALSLMAYRAWRDRAQAAEALVAASAPVVRFVNELACMTDTEAEFTSGDEIRQRARTSDPSAMVAPRIYGDEDRRRAIDALERAITENTHDRGGTRGYYQGLTVDVVAQALGMTKA